MISFYSKSVYPHLMDFILKGQERERRIALSKAYGHVLEVGFGTGLNLRYYPAAVQRLIALDVASMLPRRVAKRVRQVAFPVEQLIVAPNLRFPLEEGTFDCVVTTWTLCSVRRTTQLLAEIGRVLRPNGIYIFLEHGRAQNTRDASLQTKFSRLSEVIANGCRLDVPIDEVISQAGFQIAELRRFNNARTVRIAAPMYSGIARPPSGSSCSVVMEDEVILVDENDEPTGIAQKTEAHKEGKLHRAFSVFILNSQRELLLQKRSSLKYHSAGLWSNTCCGHPRPGEDTEGAARTRLQEEMGFDCALTERVSFIYRAEVTNSFIEYEYDHVFVGKFDGKPRLNADEATDWRWIGLESLIKSLRANPHLYTPWLGLAIDKLKNHFASI